MAETIGPMPLAGPRADRAWARMMDVYVRMQRDVSREVAKALDALEARPDVAARTIVIFTADHGEYAGSHGLRNKGGAAYEEAIRVPLWVKDPTGRFVRRHRRPRPQLASSVDFAPLLLTLATGSNAWRRDPRHEHLARRADLAAILADPGAPGRPYILHTTDEDATEQGFMTPFADGAARHVIGYRTASAKHATYSHWAPGTIEISSEDQEAETYDYGTRGGRLELDNVVRSEPALTRALARGLDRAVGSELRRPLPAALTGAQQAAFGAYHAWEARLPGA
jgi:arylsulfatase A-like enzyme